MRLRLFTLCAALSLLLCAAASIGCSADAPPPPPNVAHVRHGHGGGDALVLPTVVAVDGRVAAKHEPGPLELTPGHRELDIEVVWSNGWRDTTRLPLRAEGGHRYTLLAREAHPFMDQVGEFFAQAAGRSAAGVVLLPFAVAEELNKKPPQDRPAGTCYLWIMDAEANRPVAGTPPP